MEYDIHVVSIGAFGRAVAHQLASFYPKLDQMSWTGSSELVSASWPRAAIQVLASSQPAPSVCEFLSDLAFARGSCFIPLIVETPAVRLGPLMAPGRSGCWRCWTLRCRQHSKALREESALLNFYDAHEDAGPPGYLESVAVMGASQMAAWISGVKESDDLAGRIWQLDLFSRQVKIGRLVGVDNCVHCGLQRPLQSRTYAEARQQLAYLWREDRSNAQTAKAASTVSPRELA